MAIQAEKSSPDICQVMYNSADEKVSLAEVLHRHWHVSSSRVRKIYRFLTRSRSEQPSSATPVAVSGELRQGDRVRVRSAGDINRTLDYQGVTKGCKFLSQMARYCDQEFEVAGTVEKFFDEANCRTLKCKNLILLQGVHCDGTCVGGCDRKCFLFWRTEWLEKVS
jgi:hypothetical protein